MSCWNLGIIATFSCAGWALVSFLTCWILFKIAPTVVSMTTTNPVYLTIWSLKEFASSCLLISFMRVWFIIISSPRCFNCLKSTKSSSALLLGLLYSPLLPTWRFKPQLIPHYTSPYITMKINNKIEILNIFRLMEYYSPVDWKGSGTLKQTRHLNRTSKGRTHNS